MKRQRRAIENEMEDAGPAKLDEAYAMAMTNRVKLPKETTKAEKTYKKHIQERLRAALESYYDVVKIAAGGTKFSFCLATGKWYLSEICEATHIVTHIVPKSLESEELSYLFGGVTDLSDPRNGTLADYFLQSNADVIFVRAYVTQEHQNGSGSRNDVHSTTSKDKQQAHQV